VLDQVEISDNGDVIGSLEFYKTHFPIQLKCKQFLEVYKLFVEINMNSNNNLNK
jgi:hypothetical protein